VAAVSAASLRFAPAGAAGAALDGALARLRDALIGYVDARSRSVAIRELERLSDDTLHGLGLRRSQIRDAVRRKVLPWS
jgi:uncharacterized protein YjiS (DUF1127 family)